MKINDMGVPDIKALVAFGKAGMQLAASRILSMTSVSGVIALSGYVIYSPSWQGAACVGIVALLVCGPSIRAEAKGAEDKELP